MTDGINSGAIEPPDLPERDELVRRTLAFPYWYQRIYLGRGIYSMPQLAYHEVVWARIAPVFPADLRGASVLDVGTNAGFFALEAKRRGAGRVVGIETIDEHLRQAELCARIWNLDVEYLPLDAHRVTSIGGTFDVVVFTGILYHLKNPLQVLEDVSAMCRDAIVVETEAIAAHPDNCVYVNQGPTGQLKVTPCAKGFMKFIESTELNGDGTNWWVPDAECVFGMLRAVGFRYFSPEVRIAPTRLAVVASKTPDSVLRLDALAGAEAS